MAFADSDGVTLHVEDAGSGPPVIFAHELAADVRQWRGQITHFEDQFRCVAYNARGYPPSDAPWDDEAYVHQRFVDDIGAVQQGLELGDAWIVGWSMGGYAALLYALEHPDRVRGVVAAGVGSGSPPHEIDGFRADMDALAQCYESEGARAGAARIAASPNRQPLRRNHPQAWRAFMNDLEGHSAPGMARVCRNYQGRRPSLMDFEDRLAALEVPVLVIVGQEDPACLATSRWLAEVLPRAELVVAPGQGHAPNLEDPDGFNRALEGFLART